MTRTAPKSLAFSLILLLSTIVPSWAQPYFDRSQVIQNPRPTPSSGYGGDVDVDGEWMVVSAADESAAYVYRKSGTTWTQFTRLVCPVASCSRQNPDRGFGGSVAVDGTTLVVSINGNLGSPSWLGRLYIFNFNGGSWVFDQEISPPANFNIGDSIDLDGDVLLTTGSDLRVQDNAGWTTFVYTRSGSAWIRSELTVPGRSTSEEDLFGATVAISGDTACVGAPAYRVTGSPGAVYMFRRTNGVWAVEGPPLVPVTTAGAGVGSTCAVDGNTVAIGVERLIFQGQGSTGRTYMYQRTGTTWALTQTLVPPGPTSVFGASVAVTGNGLVVGATGDYLHPPAAVFYARENGTWIERLRSETPIPYANGIIIDFGQAAATDGQTFVVSSYNFSTSRPGVVATYVPSLTPPQTGPPSEPTAVQASVSGNALSLTWSPPTQGAAVTNYTLLARVVPGGPVLVTLPLGAVTSFNVAAPDGIYFLSLTATNALGTSLESAPAVAVVPQVAPVPGAPSGLAVSVVGSTATFTWNAPATGGAPTGYTLLAGLTPGFATPFAALPLPVTPRALAVPGIPPGVYYVRVVASNAGGTSAASNEVVLTVAAPALPTAPALNPAVVAGSTVSFSWTPGAGGGAPTSYVLLASVTPGGPVVASVPVSGTSIVVPGVPSGAYYVRVAGVNSVGTGVASSPVTVIVP
ncbi:MAG: hypothetical protein U0P30_13825 [Vicinamibacterales bacterium]